MLPFRLIPWFLSIVVLASPTFFSLTFTRLCINSNAQGIKSQCVLCRNRNFQPIINFCTDDNNITHPISEDAAFCLLRRCLEDVPLQYAPILGRRKRSEYALKGLRKSDESSIHQEASSETFTDLGYRFSNRSPSQVLLYRQHDEDQSANDFHGRTKLLDEEVIQIIKRLARTRYRNHPEITDPSVEELPNPSRFGRDRNLLLDGIAVQSEIPKRRRNDKISDLDFLKSDENRIHLLIEVVQEVSTTVESK